MAVNIVPTEISDVVLIELRVFGNVRGCFFESFSAKAVERIGVTANLR